MKLPFVWRKSAVEMIQQVTKEMVSANLKAQNAEGSHGQFTHGVRRCASKRTRMIVRDCASCRRGIPRCVPLLRYSTGRMRGRCTRVSMT